MAHDWYHRDTVEYTRWKELEDGVKIFIRASAPVGQEPVQWDWKIYRGDFYEKGDEPTEKLAIMAAEAAIPALRKEFDDYYARVNPALYGKK